MVDTQTCFEALEELANDADSFETTAYIEMPAAANFLAKVKHGSSTTRARNLIDMYESSAYKVQGSKYSAYVYSGKVSDGLRTFAQLVLKQHGALRIDQIRVAASGEDVDLDRLRRLAIEAWCEAFGIKPPDDLELDKLISARMGPKLRALQEAADGTENFATSVSVDGLSSSAQSSTLEICAAPFPEPAPDTLDILINSPKFTYVGLVSDGMKQLADLCMQREGATFRVASVSVKGKSKTLSKAELKRLAVDAWSEVFRTSAPSTAELKGLTAKRKTEKENKREELLNLIRSGPPGIREWSRYKQADKKLVSFKNSDLSNADLTELIIRDLDFQGSNFEHAVLRDASLTYCELKNSNFRFAKMQSIVMASSKCADCDFSSAQLEKANLSSMKLTGCIFHGADLTSASLIGADLRGTDFSNANLKSAVFDYTDFDEYTKWPPAFDISDPNRFYWKGSGRDPRKFQRMEALAPGQRLTFDEFITKLSGTFDKAQLHKVFKMLKAEKFQLLSEIKEASLVGIVKSQTDPDLFYSCRITSDGAFHCCTQNLMNCGGLRGALCKHLLVLIFGLIKAEELEPVTMYDWMLKSQSKKPKLDSEVATEVFLRYKQANAGDIDWRPTETIPEDYYAF